MKIDQQTIEKYVEGLNNPGTRKTYKSKLKKFTQFLENNNIGDVNQENLNTIIHDYKAHLNTLNLKAITINHHLIILKTFINDYTPLEYIKNLKLIKTEKRKPRYLTKEQIKTVMDYTDNKTDELIIKLIITTGLRIHEALQITKKELQNTDKSGNALITIIGKNTKRRQVVIPEKLVKELRKYSKPNKTYVFESQKQSGQPRSIRNIQYRFQKLAKRIDKEEHTSIYSENLKPHNLRHTFAIEALKNNEINYVKEFLGHENMATTQIYTDLKEKEVVDRFKEVEII